MRKFDQAHQDHIEKYMKYGSEIPKKPEGLYRFRTEEQIAKDLAEKKEKMRKEEE